jgi:hypothetical protein
LRRVAVSAIAVLVSYERKKALPMRIETFCLSAALAAFGCSSTPAEPPQATPVASAPEAVGSERPKVTQAQCDAQGGTSVGDIGDGATRRPDYVCPSGKPPIGSIAPPQGGPMAVEGNVCCPK